MAEGQPHTPTLRADGSGEEGDCSLQFSWLVSPSMEPPPSDLGQRQARPRILSGSVPRAELLSHKRAEQEGVPHLLVIPAWKRSPRNG